MNTEQLSIIKTAYDQIQGGISNPVKINEAYTYLPNMSEGSPMMAKIRAINRFMMLNYNDWLKEVQALAKNSESETQAVTESIGTIENKPKQTHKEEIPSDEDIQSFLTQEEKDDLKQKLAGTALQVEKADGTKAKTRTKSGTKVVANKRTGRPAQTRTLTRNK